MRLGVVLESSGANGGLTTGGLGVGSCGGIARRLIGNLVSCGNCGFDGRGLFRLINVLTWAFNGNHRLVHIEKRGGGGAERLVQCGAERCCNLLLKHGAGELIGHLDDEARRSHQTLGARKVHESTLARRDVRVAAQDRQQVRPSRLK